MHSEKVHLNHHHQNGELSYQQDKKLKSRRSTKSMSDGQNQYKFIFTQNETFQHEQHNIQPPSPIESSENASSGQVKYLSYLAQVIDSAPQNQNPLQVDEHFHRAQYWHIIYQSAIYVKKGIYRTGIDDNLMMEQFQPYFDLQRIHPTTINTKIGQQLLRNGYFMSAYAILLGRRRKSSFIFKYLMQNIKNQMQILQNQEEFNYILENYVYKDRTQQVLYLLKNQTNQTPQTPSGNNQDYLTPYRGNTNQRNFHRLKSSQLSQHSSSETVVLEDSQI